MIICNGIIKSGPKGEAEVDKDSYRCIIDIPEAGLVNGIPLRVENEPKVGDEVVVFILDDPYQNDALYMPLKALTGDSFTGIARQGFKMEFTDDGIHFSGKGEDGKMKLDLTADTIDASIDSGGSVKLSSDKVEMSTNAGGKFSADGTQLTISGFSTSIAMSGTVTPTGKGPFCGLTNCLFSGAPHAGDKVVGN